MIVPDVNLLLYAEIEAFAQHKAARAWWEDALSGNRQVGIPPVSLFGFLRISTSRRVLAPPLPMKAAVARVEGWLERRHVTMLVPGSRHLEIALELLVKLGAAGNLTTDVQIAAHAVENGGEVFSNDSDFGRFEGVRWVNPLVDSGRFVDVGAGSSASTSGDLRDPTPLVRRRASRAGRSGGCLSSPKELQQGSD